MPEKKTIDKAKKKLREGKSPSTAAGEFVHEEIEHVREGKHGARSTKQAIAIGLSKARRAGVPLPAPRKGKAKKATRKSAKRDLAAGKRKRKAPSKTRSKASKRALKRESKTTASHRALSKQAKTAAKKRTSAERSAAAKKGARSRTAAERSASARKAAKTRARRK
jgi:hypothetical protein